MKVLLLIHLGLAMVLLGASCHAAVAAWQVVLGRAAKLRLYRTYCSILLAVFPLTLALGAIIYPGFSMHVRPLFDHDLPWATGLFEIKEHMMALLLPLVAVQHACSRGSRPIPPVLQACIASCVFLAILSAAIVGSTLVTFRSL